EMRFVERSNQGQRAAHGPKTGQPGTLGAGLPDGLRNTQAAGREECQHTYSDQDGNVQLTFGMQEQPKIASQYQACYGQYGSALAPGWDSMHFHVRLARSIFRR